MYLKETIYAVKRARKPLLQLSGGRDSLCTLFVLLEHGCCDYDVVWLNTGDCAPETEKRMRIIKYMFGDRFHEINSDSVAVRNMYGIPSPMVRSEEAADVWQACTSKKFPIQSQFDCCARVTMNPVHQFTIEGNYDLVIRGCREQEELKTPVPHLTTTNAPYILAYPIYDWTHEQVNNFLESVGMLPTFYEYTDYGINCVTCPAFWGNGHQAWLEHYHPEKAIERRHQIEKLMSYMAHTIQLGFNELDSRSVTQ